MKSLGIGYGTFRRRKRSSSFSGQPSKMCSLLNLCYLIEGYFRISSALGGTCMILKVDGSSIGNPGVSGFGGLIRNSDGAWVQSFVGNIGFSNILPAELLAVYHGLALAWELDIKELWCYSDSMIVIKLLYEPVNGNTCANYLAKLGARNAEAYSSIAIPPNGMSLLLLAYASETIFST
ncbi:hypothetical protein TSUD_116140 [Trifolium subterraneum]|uniref:RNase H type-1 domain-containing protein n=1 Tax=Trifolium subterraneum TaxID=3900 RepID=A0A2Z6MMV8_TRISU|nr:hypothetical protein TSUD_116140 [Trifolium subterraneum]